MRVVVRPVHQAAKIIPLVHTPKPNSVTDPEWYSPREVDVMRDQHGLPAGELQDEALVAGFVMVI